MRGSLPVNVRNVEVPRTPIGKFRHANLTSRLQSHLELCELGAIGISWRSGKCWPAALTNCIHFGTNLLRTRERYLRRNRDRPFHAVVWQGHVFQRRPCCLDAFPKYFSKGVALAHAMVLGHPKYQSVSGLWEGFLESRHHIKFRTY